MAEVVVTPLLVLGSLCLSLLLGFYIYVKAEYNYFKQRGIPFDRPTFPFGSFTSTALLKTSFSSVLAEIYAIHKKHSMFGFFAFWKKGILINDPEIIRQILIKDFDVFQDRGVYYNKKKDPLSAHLFSLAGNEWRTLRKKLIPTFSPGKINGMSPIIIKCADEMKKYIAELNCTNSAVNCQNLFFSYGLAVISNTAFGLNSDAFTNKDSTFVKMAKKMLAPTVDRLLATILLFDCDVAKFFNLRVVPSEVSDFFMGVFKDTVKFREKNHVDRKDYFQLLIQLKDTTPVTQAGSELRLTDNDLAAEAFVFILAGSETTSTTMSCCMYELAMNPEVQTKLLGEVDSLQEINYDTINSLEYLDMVVNETLRKYPALGFLNRECSRDYEVPGTDAVIQKGTQIFISVQGLHNDPELFPNPELFIPERFKKENKVNMKFATYMPFGEGPRHCIGKRFAKVSVKTGLAVVLRSYQVTRAPCTPAQVMFEPRTVMTTPAGVIWLTLQERTPEKNIAKHC